MTLLKEVSGGSICRMAFRPWGLHTVRASSPIRLLLPEPLCPVTAFTRPGRGRSWQNRNRTVKLFPSRPDW